MSPDLSPDVSPDKGTPTAEVSAWLAGAADRLATPARVDTREELQARLPAAPDESATAALDG